MNTDKKFVIRCRAVIIHDGKLLLVRHAPKGKFFALPGGHLEFGEDVKECVEREILEELGVKPIIGNLLYINTYSNEPDVQSMEFFFEVKNSSDYLDISKLPRSHASEIAEMRWINPDDNLEMRPQKFMDDFKNGKMDYSEIRFIK